MRRTPYCAGLLALAFALSLAACDAASPDFTAPSASVDFSAGALGPPLTGSGTAVIHDLEVFPIREAGPNRIQERRLTGTLFGTLEGTFVEHARGTIHGTGLVTYQATFVFEGTVDGCEGPGTFRASLSGTGQAGLPETDATFRVIDQASNTLRIGGTGTMRQVGPTATYTVRYVCR
jgi:hypothetical protein